MRTLLITPTYDEGENIEQFLRRARAAVPDADILVVDDNSPDGTADLADEVGAQLGHVEVLRRPRNGSRAKHCPTGATAMSRSRRVPTGW